MKKRQPLTLNDKVLKPPIFIGGEGRSGTRLLRHVIGKNKNIFEIEKETYIFGTSSLKTSMLFTKLALTASKDNLTLAVLTSMFYPLEGAYKKIKNNNYPQFIKDLLKSIKELEEYRSVKNKYDCFNLCANYLTQAENKTRWVEKTPSNIFNFNEIVSLYPEAKFIIIFRDPRAVCLSWFSKDKYKTTLAVSLRWNKIISQMNKLANDYKENVYSVKYEDLVLNPKQEITRICDFIEEDFDPEMLNIEVVNTHFKDSSSKSGFNKEAVSRWKRSLSKNQKLLIDLITKKNRNGLGYEDSSEKPHNIPSFMKFTLGQPLLTTINKLQKVISL